MQMMDAKDRVLQELMAHLDKKDGDDLGEAMKPKGMGLEVTKIDKIGDEPEDSNGDSGEEVSPGMEAQDGSSPKMSDEEMQELIEAIQSKLGA